MSLKIYEELEQGTDEWLEARRGIVTASVIGQLITPSTLKVAKNATSRSKIAELAAERITGRVEDTPISWQMERGNEEEDRARELYEQHYGPLEQVGFMVREVDGIPLGFSPDGLSGDDGVVEFKSRSPKIHVQHVISGKVPPENMAQVMTGLYVTRRSWCDYTSFSNGMAMWRTRVFPDSQWFTAIEEALHHAESAILQVISDYENSVVGAPVAEYIEPFEDMEIQV